MKRIEHRPFQVALGGLLTASLLLVLTACEVPLGPLVRPFTAASGQAAPAVPATPVSSEARVVVPAGAYTAHLELSPSHAKVGEVVNVRGSGYPPGATVELVWYSVNGRYELRDGTEFVGERFVPQSRVLTTVQANMSGAIQTRLTVPPDYGGSHDLRGRVAGREISQAGLTIDPTFSMTPVAGPVGTMIELKIVGVDWRQNINTWHVLYDNRYLGFISAVTTGGVAVARFRAAGPIGDHFISVWHNSINPIPYLNFQQGPFKDVPVASFTFRVTSDPGLLPARVEDFSVHDNPWPAAQTGPGILQLSPDRGIVGQSTILSGRGLPVNTRLQLRWWTMIGNRVSSTGFAPASRDLGNVTTGPDGTFRQEITIPDDLGGQHRIEVVADGRALASTGLVIEPSVIAVTPTRVRAGETVHLHLKGVGWTTYDNTYAVTYDNAYIGYVCGFSTNGDVEFTITATGMPGTHLIDLYPTIYKGEDQQPRIYSVPQLTYATDHPQRITPAIRLSIEVIQ
jgi:hypothetical protein